jgi:DNA damage-inducible protein 1
LVAALEDPQAFARLFADSLNREQRERAERHRQIQLLNADPFDPEAQARIAEIIRQEQVMENLQNAMEHNPEGDTAAPLTQQQRTLEGKNPVVLTERLCLS